MPLPSSFHEFIGNSHAVADLRAAIATGKLPHSLILAGSSGSGKYTLALLLTLALECERQPRETAPDGRTLASFCGVCRNCTRILESAELEPRIAEAVAAREEMRETDKKDTRVLVQTHPDVLIVPPDPPQLLIKLGQIRTVIARAQYVPTEAPARVFIITSGAFMKEAANSLLKLLEEPPERVYLILLAENTGDLLPTIRSRCAVIRLGSLPAEEIAALLAQRRPELKPSERDLVARLSEGAAGRALSFDLAAYIAARADALTLLGTLEHANDHSALFKMTESYRAGAEGQEKTNALLNTLRPAARRSTADAKRRPRSGPQHRPQARPHAARRRTRLRRNRVRARRHGRRAFGHAPQSAALAEPRRLRRWARFTAFCNAPVTAASKAGRALTVCSETCRRPEASVHPTA